MGIAVAAAVAVAAALGGYAWLELAPRRTPPGQPALVTIDAHSLDAFRAEFDEGAAGVRVLVLLSPT
jgi:hypothetical protein